MHTLAMVVGRNTQVVDTYTREEEHMSVALLEKLEE